jgi:CRISPR-associated protein Cmr4
MAVTLAFIHALSSLHAGTGQGVDVIDLPIARERASNLPFLPGSSIKGCLRDDYRRRGGADEDVVFGSEDPHNAFSGALHISDARLLLLPVRCLGTSFVWTTSPYILRRLQRDVRAAGLPELPAIPELPKGQASITTSTPLTKVEGAQKLVLEELDFTRNGAGADKWAEWIGKGLFAGDADAVAWQNELKSRFAIVDDDSFQFLSEFSTEVNAHIKIDENTGTVERGGLWYQESLPAETALVSLVQAERSWKPGVILTGEQVLDRIAGRRFLQFGGKATTGQGAAYFVPWGVAV